MLRTMIAAAAALILVSPAAAQTTGYLTDSAWNCRMTSLVGDPGANLIINFGDDNSLYASFYLEMPEGEDVISVEFDVMGEWQLSESVISMAMSGSEVVGAWLNDEEMDYEVVQEIGAGLAAELSSFAGESTIAYIAQHAMVLEEPETSISCWR
jgi:hypothetical protein